MSKISEMKFCFGLTGYFGQIQRQTSLFLTDVHQQTRKTVLEWPTHQVSPVWDLYSLGKRANKNFMKFNKALCLGGNPHAPAYGGCRLARKKKNLEKRKRPLVFWWNNQVPGGYQIENEPAMCLCCKEGQQYSGLF